METGLEDPSKKSSPVKNKRRIKSNKYCNVCKKEFGAKRNYEDHVARKHSKDPQKLKCKYCEKSFSLKRDLEQHERYHGTKPRFPCDICGKEYATQINLDEHQIDHDKTKSQHSCGKCEKRFSHESSLKKHVKVSHEEAFKCGVPDCQKVLTSKNNLQNHIRTKHGNQESQFRCVACDKSFVDQHRLRAHKKTKKHIKNVNKSQTETRSVEHDELSVGALVSNTNVFAQQTTQMEIIRTNPSQSMDSAYVTVNETAQ